MFIDDLLVAVRRTPKGLAILVDPNAERQEIIRAMGEIQIAVTKSIIYREAAIKAGMGPEKGGIITAARRNLFRR